MNKKNLWLLGAGQALAVSVYIGLVAWLMNNGERLFGEMDSGFMAPVVFLLLFVFSALVTSSLVLAKPLMLYLEGEKKQAIQLFLYTGLSLFVILIIGLSILIFG